MTVAVVSDSIGIGGNTVVDTVLLANVDLAATPASTVEIDVTGMKEFQIIVDRVTHANSCIRCMQFSVNGGSTWFNTSGDYLDIPSNGVSAPLASMTFHLTSNVAACSGNNTVYQPGNSIPPQVYNQVVGDVYMFVGSTSPINRVRVFGGTASSGTPNVGNMTGGKIIAWGKR